MFLFISVKISLPGLLSSQCSGEDSPGTYFAVSRLGATRGHRGIQNNCMCGEFCKWSQAPPSPAAQRNPQMEAPAWPTLTPRSGKQGHNSLTGENKTGYCPIPWWNSQAQTNSTPGKVTQKQGRSKTQWRGISRWKLKECSMLTTKLSHTLEFQMTGLTKVLFSWRFV